MSRSKLTRLRQLSIPKPCAEKWEGMAGDDKKRFCEGCGCHVHNIAGLKAKEAEKLLANPGRVCTRILCDPARGILTKDGWIARLVVAGAVAASVAGCSTNINVEVNESPKPSQSGDFLGTHPAPASQYTLGDVAAVPAADETHEVTGKRALPPQNYQELAGSPAAIPSAKGRQVDAARSSDSAEVDAGRGSYSENRTGRY